MKMMKISQGPGKIFIAGGNLNAKNIARGLIPPKTKNINNNNLKYIPTSKSTYRSDTETIPYLLDFEKTSSIDQKECVDSDHSHVVIKIKWKITKKATFNANKAGSLQVVN